MNNYYTLVRKNGEIRLAGMDTAKLSIIAENDEYIVIKENGANHWSGRGEQTYCPPEITVYQKEGDQLFPLIRWSTGRKPK
jgi:hypothetical protein